MRIFVSLLAALILAACSEKPAAETKKAPEPPPAPITGRRAFQFTFGPAHAWATDCQPMHVRSINLATPKSGDGKAGAWEVLYVSQSRGQQRIYTWSAVEAEGNLHKGVFAGLEESWDGPAGQSQSFLPAALRIDTPDAFHTAIDQSAEYIRKSKKKPRVNFQLEQTSRFPDPVWRVFWGESISGAEWSVFIDATNGQYLGH
ncbi:MAG TPA: hypothetical protein VK419_08565 [Bryobacteraceae bacterium]|nr:hypothetical protein [Bryobacteraceae bacterium]